MSTPNAPKSGALHCMLFSGLDFGSLAQRHHVHWIWRWRARQFNLDLGNCWSSDPQTKVVGVDWTVQYITTTRMENTFLLFRLRMEKDRGAEADDSDSHHVTRSRRNNTVVCFLFISWPYVLSQLCGKCDSEPPHFFPFSSFVLILSFFFFPFGRKHSGTSAILICRAGCMPHTPFSLVRFSSFSSHKPGFQHTHAHTRIHSAYPGRGGLPRVELFFSLDF